MHLTKVLSKENSILKMLSIKVLIIQDTNSSLVQKAQPVSLGRELSSFFETSFSSPGKYLKIWYFSELFWAIIAVFNTDLFTA